MRRGRERIFGFNCGNRRWSWWNRRSWIKDYVQVAREDIDKLTASHVCTQSIVERHRWFRGVRWFVEEREKVGSVCDTMLEDKALGILMNVGYSRAGR